MPSMRSVDFALSGFRFPGASAANVKLPAFHRSTGLAPCWSSPALITWGLAI